MEIVALIVIGTMGGLLFAGAIILFVVVYQRRMTEQQLHLQQRELDYQQQLLSATLQAETRERESLAQELHDGLLAQLSSIKMTSQQLLRLLPPDSQQATDIGEHVLSTISASMEEARNLSHALVPPTLRSFGLAKALQHFVSMFRHAGTEVIFNDEGYINRLTPQGELLLYQIARELVQNALKHAQASMITIRLRQQPDRVFLEVTDNGKGFDTDLVSRENEQAGLGYRNIRSRLQLTNGVLKVNSAPGSGTRIEVEVPFTEKVAIAI